MQDLTIIMAGSFFCLHRMSPSSQLQSWIRIGRLRGGGAVDLSYQYGSHIFCEKRKALKNILLMSEKHPITVCAAAVGSLGTFDKCCPLSPVIPHSITSSHTLSLLLQQGALQSSGFLLLLSSPQDADNHACSQAQRLYQHFSRKLLTHTLFFFLRFLNAPLYLLTHTSWYMSPW